MSTPGAATEIYFPRLAAANSLSSASVAFPRGRNEDRMLDAGLLHHRAEFLMCQRLRKMRLATGHPGAVRRFRRPDVNAGINDHHYRSTSTLQSACALCRRKVRQPTCGAV